MLYAVVEPLVVIDPVAVPPPEILKAIYVCDPDPALKQLKVVFPLAACTFNFASIDVTPMPKLPFESILIASSVAVPAPPAFTAKEIAAEGVVSSAKQLINARTNSPSPLGS